LIEDPMRYPSGKTAIYAILAHPVAHVRAPEFMNPFFEAAGRDGFLVPFHVLPEDLDDLIPRLKAIQNLKGFVVTIPHKPAMAAMCKTLGPGAKATGTANTIRIEADGSLTGDMFDGLGLVEGCRANGIEPTGKAVLMVGAGGAGRAIAFALADAGVTRLTIANRTAAKAEAVAAAVAEAFPGVTVAAGPADATGHEVIIQATSLGLKTGDALPMDPATLTPEMQLFDIIAVRDTELMVAARDAGLKTVVGGRPMIEHQAKAQIAFLDPPALAG
jgi:shikimate dehydrogenase